MEGFGSKVGGGGREGRGEGRNAWPKKGQGQEKEVTAQRCIKEFSDFPACWPTLAFCRAVPWKHSGKFLLLAVQESAGLAVVALAKHLASALFQDRLLTPPLEGTLGEGSQRFLKSEGDFVLPFHTHHHKPQ